MGVARAVARALLGGGRCLMPVLLLLASSTVGFTVIPDMERKALIALYEATDGPNWIYSDGWLGAPGTECDWGGVYCDSQRRHVSQLSLGLNGLTGDIPPQIGDLSSLIDLHLEGNQLSSLPPEFGKLSSLRNLYLEDNQLTDLPAEIGKLSNLYGLRLQNNQLTTLPPEIGDLDVDFLALLDNQLVSLPPEFGNLSSLDVLNLENNHMSSLPQSIGNISGLSRLYLRGNTLLSLPLELIDTSVYVLDIRWNAIDPVEPELRALLDSVQPTWLST